MPPIITNLPPNPIILHLLTHLHTLHPLITPSLSSAAADVEVSQPLPFGRRSLPFFDEITSTHSKISRSIIKTLYDTYYGKGYFNDVEELNYLAKKEVGVVASLVLESMSACPKSSIEGLSAIYDPLISLGSSLLLGLDPVSSVRQIESLVTSYLPESSAEILKGLQKLRSLTSNDRLSFRFIERITPCLLRPPGGGGKTIMWSVKHQNDMRAAVVVVEVLLDNVDVFFREGWEERGREIREERERNRTESEEKQDEEGALNDTNKNGGEDLEEAKKEENNRDASVEANTSAEMQSDTSQNEPSSPNYSSPNSPHSQHNQSSSPSHHPAHTSPHHPYSAAANALDAQSVQLLDQLCKLSISNVILSAPPAPEDPPATNPNAFVQSVQTPPRSPSNYNLSSPPASPRRSNSPQKSSSSSSNSLTPTNRLTSFDRRCYITACRTLRHQISLYESSFQSVHNRKPSSSERTGMESTYRQYGTWKRTIRSDSIIRLQGVVRGWSVRRNVKLHEDVTSKLQDMEVDSTPTRPECNTDEKENDTPRLSSKALFEKKRSLKNSLKNFDINFQKKYGRMPVKSEKEPIRHLYEEYNRCKEEIERMGGKVESKVSTMEQLKLEKAQLHQKLRAFEKDFVEKQGRQVSSFNDIKPVAGLYRRYKELKKALK
ncbi:hypothetical protein TrST_g9156 [Triparma strigata]|uniref:FAM13A-like domain-containing protein n=1 Tax=Triparma strigata TaxID=1606541 RepID=A0A9W7C4J4_9STRA|nr:hypothetical protein TrST_g9156 [Triparma strigata]